MTEKSWYYVKDNKPVGPIPEGKMQEMFDAGNLGQETLVWSESMSEWTPASKVESFQWKAVHFPPVPSMQTFRPSKKINPHLFTAFFWSGAILLFLSPFLSPFLGAGGKEAGPPWRPGLLEISSLLGISMLIFALIYSYIIVYRCWSILQDSTARTTPGKAVGFLFIPFFSLYWNFVAIRGLAEDANAFLNSKGINENKVSVGLSLAICIIAPIPVVSTVNAVLCNILVYQLARFFNYSVTNLGVKYK